MKLYLSTVGIAMLTVSGLNILFGTAPWYHIICAVIYCVILNFMLDAAIAILIKIMPNRWFMPENPSYHVFSFERKLYGWLNVRRWKDKVLQLGGIGGFSKRRIKEPNNPKYIERFIIECNKGVLTHRLCYFVGFFVMLIISDKFVFSVALPSAVVNLYLNVLPTIVLRYNTPMLKSVLARLRRISNTKKEDDMLIQHR